MSAGVQPLRRYEGPVEAYAIDPGSPFYRATEPTNHYILTNLVVDDHIYDDAVCIYVDGIERNEPFYLTIENAWTLVEMLTRDIDKLSRIIELDPED